MPKDATATGIDVSDQFQPPEGFRPVEVKSDFINLLGRFYQMRRDGRRVFGIRVEPHHLNSAGNAHGGFLLSAADFALSWGTHAPGDVPPRATLSLSMDFAAPARVGDWLEVDVDVVRSGQRIAFVNCFLSVNGNRIGRASGAFRIAPIRDNAVAQHSKPS